MERIRRYEKEPYLHSLQTSVEASGQDERGPWVRLEDTIFYPEGGGQPSDRGSINGIPIVDVQKVRDGIRHYLSDSLERGVVSLQLDWARRFDHMQQHTAQHLITALAADQFGWRTTAFHLGSEQSDIELDIHSIPQERLRELEEWVCTAVRSSLPVSSRRVSVEEFDELRVRTRGLPRDHRGSIRLVEIEGIDLNTCGGTHVMSTSELEAVSLLQTESIRGQTRVYYVAGARLRRRLAGHESILAELRNRLDSGNSDLEEAVGRLQEQNRNLARQVAAQQEELALAQVESLLALPPLALTRHFEDKPLSFLQQIGRQVVAREPRRFIFLTGATAGSREGNFVLAAGAESGLNLEVAGNSAATILEGRGGGRAPIFQGKATRLDRHDQAWQEILRNSR